MKTFRFLQVILLKSTIFWKVIQPQLQFLQLTSEEYATVICTIIMEEETCNILMNLCSLASYLLALPFFKLKVLFSGYSSIFKDEWVWEGFAHLKTTLAQNAMK